MTDKQLLEKVLEELELLKKENKQLKLRIVELETKLEKYENPKNSGNSSIPPSQDPFRKTKSLRGKSKRRPGGQKGRKGKKLEMAPTPDEVVLHDITKCDCCGHAMPRESEGYDARQVFDLPPIKIFVTEHRRAKKTCRHCWSENKGGYTGLSCPPYGSKISVLPFRRMLTPYMKKRIPFKEGFRSKLTPLKRFNLIFRFLW